jgi:hypothetical protein
MIDFSLTRYTEKVSENFEYKLAIDFLVAQNLFTFDLNMTFYKVGISLQQLNKFHEITTKEDG